MTTLKQHNHYEILNSCYGRSWPHDHELQVENGVGVQVGVFLGGGEEVLQCRKSPGRCHNYITFTDLSTKYIDFFKSYKDEFNQFPMYFN